MERKEIEQKIRELNQGETASSALFRHQQRRIEDVVTGSRYTGVSRPLIVFEFPHSTNHGRKDIFTARDFNLISEKEDVLSGKVESPGLQVEGDVITIRTVLNGQNREELKEEQKWARDVAGKKNKEVRIVYEIEDNDSSKRKTRRHSFEYSVAPSRKTA